MTAGRPQKVPRKYIPLWVQVQPAVVTELEAYARELAARVTPGLNVTRQDAARGVFNAWLRDRQAVARRKRTVHGRQPAARPHQSPGVR